MRKLLNTLYVTTPDVYLSLDGENIVVLQDDNELGRFPLHYFEGIVSFNYKGASPALMGACAKRNISLCFMTSHGRFLARVTGEVRGNVVLRKNQYQMSENQADSIKLARNFILGKVFNSRWIIERATRDYALRIDTDRLKNVSSNLHNSLSYIRGCSDFDRLRGLEGEAASQYFSVFDDLILNQKDKFYFNNRNRRPPTDNVNALLSFIYSILGNEIAAALETVGLDAYVGFLHTDRPGRASLALDLLEEFRGIMADRFVLSLINMKKINDADFFKKENGAVILTDEARKKVLSSWQLKKLEKITHPFLNEKIEWGLVPYVQAMLLARYIRGDLDEYPPFLWK